MAQLKRYGISELHISTSSGFTPSAATLWDTGKSGSFKVVDLSPGTTYYYRIVHRDLRGNVGAMTAEQSFVAGYTELLHIDPGLRQNVSARPSANITVADSNTAFLIPFDVVDLDPEGCWDAVLSKFTANADGWFQFRVRLEIGGVTPGDCANIYLDLNGSGDALASGVPSTVITLGSSDLIFACLDRVIQLSAGDYVRPLLFCIPENSGHFWTIDKYLAQGDRMGSYIEVTQLLS